MRSWYKGWVSDAQTVGCGNCAHADKGRTSGSEGSLEFPEAGLSSSSSSDSDETDGARKVPLLRGELKGRRLGEIRAEERSRRGELRTAVPALEMGTTTAVR